MFPQREHLQVQGGSRSRNKAEQEGSSPEPRAHPQQDGDCRRQPRVKSTLCIELAPAVFKTIELHKEIQASGGNPREASTLGPSCRQEAVSWGLKPPLATVPAIPYCPPPAHPPHLCSRPAPWGICICTSGPGGDRGWKRLREGGPGSPARQDEREQRRVWRVGGALQAPRKCRQGLECPDSEDQPLPAAPVWPQCPGRRQPIQALPARPTAQAPNALQPAALGPSSRKAPALEQLKMVPAFVPLPPPPQG